MALDKRKLSKAVKDKYSFANETFFHTAKSNPKDKIDVEIGDSKQVDFKPQFKVMRWDNEVNLSFRLKDDGVEQELVDTVGDKIVWKKGKREAYFYDLPVGSEHEEGGYEFEVVLLEKPVTNIVEFSLNTKGLDFFYQPALTAEEIAEGSKRPENVVGSYAVYASEQKTNYFGGKEYKTGKVGHIFRPQIEDANGTKVWGELNVDTVNGILSVTIPQEFLDNAVYPVRHAAGLTFGYTSAGASAGNMHDIIRGATYSLPSTGTVSKLTIYMGFGVNGDFDVTAKAKGAIYLQSDASLKASTVEVNGAGEVNTWIDFSFSSPPTLSAADYVLTAWGSDPVDSTLGIAYDAVSIFRYGKSPAAYTGTFPDPFDGTTGNANFKYSIYATYTAAGGSDPTPLRMLMGMGT